MKGSKEKNHSIKKKKPIRIDHGMIEAFRLQLMEEEKSAATVEKYLRDVRQLQHWLAGQPPDKAAVIAFKQDLISRYQPDSVNSMLVAVNRFLESAGMGKWKVKLLRVQKSAFRRKELELTQAEYERLVRAARSRGDDRMGMLLQTICATGIRVGEIRYITVEAVRAGAVEVTSKGKSRMIMITRSLQKVLKQYIAGEAIESGYVFRTKSGQPMNRSNIWRAMKRLCEAARVPEAKVFPHNLRHLFARTFYNLKKDVAKLADVLGHSQIETTRRYIMSTGAEHRRQMEALHLVL